MAMPVSPGTPNGWTVEMLATLPDDGNRYEIIGGELIVSPSPAPVHQRALKLLVMLLAPYAEEGRRAELFFAPADVIFTPRDVVEPDLFVVPHVEGPTPRRWDEFGPVFLVVEILSPSTEFNDRQRKLRLYQRERVPEYWIVSCDERLIERWRPGDERPEVLTETLTWHLFAERAPLVIDLVSFFARVHGER
jgi:Uma2 family endonuclease